MELLAVYGTLKRGKSNHRVIERGCVYHGTTWVEGWTMYNLGAYPAVVQDTGDGAISVELFGVPDLAATDRLEGYPGYYNRKQIDTPLGKAWIYYMDVGHLSGVPIVPHGVWE